MKTPKFLYRALRQVEIESGFVLIPKSTDIFASDPMFGIDNTNPMHFGSSLNSVRQHQYKQNGLPTRGVSTTPIFERAKFYGKRLKHVAKINTSRFDEFDIEIFNVNIVLKNYSHDIAFPEDQEIILVQKSDGAFPPQIIEEIIKL